MDCILSKPQLNTAIFAKRKFYINVRIASETDKDRFSFLNTVWPDVHARTIKK